ncbi:MAG TPA: protein-ADP-ribose hydrolase [Actinomycetota bacterium]|nr:protein-ADP-ribose hydrolase [Actinomycetota bacterium]
MFRLSEYRDLVELDRPFVPAAAPAPPEELPSLTRRALGLLSEGPLPATVDPRAALRDLLTLRQPSPLPPDAAPVLDALLGGERELRPRVDPKRLPSVAEDFPGTSHAAAATTALWRGDVTTLAADAVVNAANSALLGCFLPNHPCIDNAIHAAAGPHLRADCAEIVRAQGAAEPTGSAKVTRGYHLPARYVLHTVGPIVHGEPGDDDAAALASCYRSCLDLAASLEDVRTVAFCSISTGVFGYPKGAAARVALATVAEWFDAHPGRLERVVFDVFTADDLDVYTRAFSEDDRDESGT